MVIVESRLTFGQLHFCAKVFTVNASIMTYIRNTLITLSYPWFAAEKIFFCLRSLLFDLYKDANVCSGSYSGCKNTKKCA